MKYILLPPDFSDNAWNAIFTAIKLFGNIDCHFILLNTYEPKFANLMGNKSKERLGVIYDSLSKNSNLQLEKALEYLKANHSRNNHKFEKKSISNDIENAINQLVQEKDIDLVIMGTTGATAAKEVFMGSNTVKVIKKVRSCPILAVPHEFDFKSLNSVVFPTNFTRSYSKNELKPLIDLTMLWKAEIMILQVAQEYTLSDQQKANQQILIKRFAGVKHSLHKVDMWNNVAEATNKFATENGADLIALIHYSHTFFEKLTREPVIRKMGFHSKVPLLVLPDLV